MIVWRGHDVGLRVEFKDDLVVLFHSSPYTWYCTHGLRTREEQNKLYNIYITNGKPKAAPPGKSPHEYGMAVDVVLDIDPDKPGLQPSWNIKLLAWLWLFTNLKLHPRLKSGISFDDGDHIEVYKWTKYI